jgi:hypothetical protein
MGRDQTRVLVGAAVSLALIVAATLIMEWYRLSLDALPAAAGRVEIDLHRMRICNALHVCTSAPLSLLPGMFPTLASSSLWSSLAVAGLIAFQAGARLLTGQANQAASKLGYVLALSTVVTVAATVYLFGPETEGPAIAQLQGVLQRTWAPVLLIAGLLAGVAALYAAIAPASADDTAAYKPVVLAAARATAGAAARVPSGAMPPIGSDGQPSDPIRALLRPGEEIRAVERTSGPIQSLHRISGPIESLARTTDPIRAIADSIQPLHRPSGQIPPIQRISGSMAPLQRATGSIQPLQRISGSMSPLTTTTGRIRSEPLPVTPAHLRNRISYVALTAELTSGGVDARREDGSSRLVLWRDVVGVVARRMPDDYDGMTFVDIISTAGSTLRIVPWTRLTGAPIEDGDARPRGIVERVVAMCPAARLDPATRTFLETGEAAQLPDLDTLQAHDAHLA